jgi:hypothetical protein
LVKPVDLRVLTEILAEVPKEPIVE